MGGQSRGGAASLDVDYHERQFGHHRQSHGLGLERESRSGGGGHSEAAGEGRADRGADARYLVLGLEGLGPEALVDGQLLEYAGCRGDGV